MIDQTTIEHTLQWLKVLTRTQPNGMSDTLDYLHDSRQAMEMSIDLIEQLAQQTDDAP